MTRVFTAIILFSFLVNATHAQSLSLRDALQTALNNYGSIKARKNYVEASKASVSQARRDYLPNLVVSAQQDYGTINGQNGPLYGFGGFAVASSGLPLPQQNWNAAFGALYLANINWEFFTFGRNSEKIKVAKSSLSRDESDLAQEQFQHQVKVAAAYLNLLAAQRITLSQEKNLERAQAFQTTAASRARNGLNAGVDSSLANAEVSNAKIALTRARDTEQEQAARLAVLMGVATNTFVLDSAFVSRLPQSLNASSSAKANEHPILRYYRSRLEVGNEQLSYYRRFYFPSFSLFGVIQERGSGFEAAYTQNQNAYTTDYGSGVKPTRGNYLLGVGMTWNLTSTLRVNSQVRSQRFMAQGLKDEYDMADQQLNVQKALAENKLKNALDNYNEAPVQVKAASDAYTQKNALYKNGLSTMVELTQAMYALNRAETDRDIAYSNVWQALLLKAAAAGDLELFTKEF